MKQLKINVRPNRVAVLSVLCSVLLHGCAATVLRPVQETDKDTSGSFNGRWLGEVISTAPVQSGPGNWRLNCSDASGSKFMMVVNDGVVNYGSPPDQASAFINSDGKFRIESPLEEEVKADDSSVESVGNGKVTLIIYGSLASGKGSVTFGIAQFSNNGCTSKIDFTKV